MRRKKRPLDWVINPSLWDASQAPFYLNPTAGGPPATAGTGERIAEELTTHFDIAAGTNTRLPMVEQTSVRIRGVVHYGINTLDPENLPSGRCGVHLFLRVRKSIQQVGAFFPQSNDDAAVGVGLSSAYDMRTPQAANDDFLWTFHDYMIYSSSFWVEWTAGNLSWTIPQTVEIDVPVKRRLRQRELLVLDIQASAAPYWDQFGVNAYDPPPHPEFGVWVDPYVRTLIQTNT